MKKREVLRYLNDAIIALSNMSADAAKIEVTDNDTASRQLKKSIIAFRAGPLQKFYDSVNEAREEIRAKPKRKYERKF